MFNDRKHTQYRIHYNQPPKPKDYDGLTGMDIIMFLIIAIGIALFAYYSGWF